MGGYLLIIGKPLLGFGALVTAIAPLMGLLIYKRGAQRRELKAKQPPGGQLTAGDA
jgi:hypothetical protein